PLCLWALWSRMEPGRDYSDADNTRLLNAWASFGDHALLRRALVDMGYVARTSDGRIYRRIEQKPPAALSVLLKRIAPQGARSHAPFRPSWRPSGPWPRGRRCRPWRWISAPGYC